MAKFFTRHELYKLRNSIPLADVLSILKWPHKMRDGRVCFVCPQCSESLTAINQRTNLRLDWTPGQAGYTVFGEVTDGMDVVDAIAAVPTGSRGGHQDVPVEAVQIIEVTVDE